MFGFGSAGPFGGPSMLSSMFNDPFFTDPFGHMEQMMGASAFGSRPAHQAPAAHRGRREPQIEEVHDDTADDYKSAADEGIVEEPDDDAPPAARPAKRQQQSSTSTSVHHPGSALQRAGSRRIPVQGQIPSIFDAVFGGGPMQLTNQPGVQSYSYSSSSYSTGGRNGITYQSTQTSRMGPGGVREFQSTVRDGRTGEQSMSITRGLEDRERTIRRVRDGSGQETRDEVLRGMSEEEAARFEAEWMEQAERNLNPMGGARGTRTSTQPSRPALQLHAPPPPQPQQYTQSPQHTQTQPSSRHVHSGVDGRLNVPSYRSSATGTATMTPVGNTYTTGTAAGSTGAGPGAYPGDAYGQDAYTGSVGGHAGGASRGQGTRAGYGQAGYGQAGGQGGFVSYGGSGRYA